MDGHRLRVRIGTAEFEAEGSEDAVDKRFDQFLKLLGRAPTEQPSNVDDGVHRLIDEDLGSEHLKRMYELKDEDGRKIVTLRVPPQGPDRASNAILLVLYGYKRLASMDEVPVTMLRTSVEQSVGKIGRIDHRVAPLKRDNLLLIAGPGGKGSKYRLTVPGLSKAYAEIAKLLQTA